jgi:hypothetical protein
MLIQLYAYNKNRKYPNNTDKIMFRPITRATKLTAWMQFIVQMNIGRIHSDKSRWLRGWGIIWDIEFESSMYSCHNYPKSKRGIGRPTSDCPWPKGELLYDERWSVLRPAAKLISDCTALYMLVILPRPSRSFLILSLRTSYQPMPAIVSKRIAIEAIEQRLNAQG